jgi:hypothetical protein
VRGVLTGVLTLRPPGRDSSNLVTLYASFLSRCTCTLPTLARLVEKTVAAAKERRRADMGYEHGPSDYVVLKVRLCISARGTQQRVCKLTPRMPQTCSCRSAVSFSFWTYYGSSAPTRANGTRVVCWFGRRGPSKQEPLGTRLKGRAESSDFTCRRIN